MQLGLKDKVIIVTGGAKGIGKAIVDMLVEEDAIPVIADLDESALQNVVQEYKQQSKRIGGLAGNLIPPENCQQVIRYTVEQFGNIDGLVNNAGVNDKVGLEAGPDAFITSLQKNLHHVYNMAHYSLPHLKKSRGPIVNISSKTALTGQGNTSGYIAAKGGVLGLTREWAVDLKDDGIRVNAVVPAEVWTPLYESYVNTFDDPEAAKKEIEAYIPLGRRMTTPREIASMVVYLLSNQASHITGQFMHVDGGYVHLDRMV